ncbi:FANCD2 opposite strand protein [Engystomops pustulosus]|uniref:FANCD2 opposite strand protein n=1 Tax=Engystomops pustulosus TaxID=76066 RepID=UPI003AFACCBC
MATGLQFRCVAAIYPPRSEGLLVGVTSSGGRALTGAVMASYQLWSPWTSLDESLRWIRGATPKPHGRPPLPACPPRRRAAAECRGIIEPQPLPLRGLDLVFGRLITAQPPRCCSRLQISANSAFFRVISRGRHPQLYQGTEGARMLNICKQLLRAMILLYTLYKRCSFTIQLSDHHVHDYWPRL